jgi:hypothetical protein
MKTTWLRPLRLSEKALLRKVLLTCGIISTLYYFAINVFVTMQYEGYNAASQTVSELSAIGTPTRSMWVFLVTIYGLFIVAFGAGVWQSGNGNRYLRLSGGFMVAYSIIGFFWPPMHQREVLAAGEGSLTDTLHIAWTMITVPLMLLIIGFGAAALGKIFRIYSAISFVVLIVFGFLTGIASPDMEANLPTPWMGVWERISIGAYMVWVMVFAMMLLRAEKLLHERTVSG